MGFGVHTYAHKVKKFISKIRMHSDKILLQIYINQIDLLQINLIKNLVDPPRFALVVLVVV